jgi:5-enolpyruvylshikimate-3-phosphate synthase
LLSALSSGVTNVENLLESADIRYMLEALKQLKVHSSLYLTFFLLFSNQYNL